MIKSKYKKESKLTFEIEPLTRVEALREGNKLKEDGKSNIVLYNQNDKTYSVFDKKHYDYLMDSNEVDMSQWKEIKQFEAPEENPDQGTEIVQKEPAPESNDNLDIDLNEPESSADNTSNITSDEITDEELNDENIEEENPEESEEDMNVEYNKTTPDEMEEIIKKENYNRRLNEEKIEIFTGSHYMNSERNKEAFNLLNEKLLSTDNPYYDLFNSERLYLDDTNGFISIQSNNSQNELYDFGVKGLANYIKSLLKYPVPIYIGGYYFESNRINNKKFYRRKIK